MGNFEKLKEEAMKAVEAVPLKSSSVAAQKDQAILKKRFPAGKLILLAFFAVVLSVPFCNSTSKSPISQQPAPAYVSQANVPHFDIISNHNKSAFSIVVAPETSSDQLTALINEFKNARIHNGFSKYFTATTSGGVMGDYAIIWIFVFKDRAWATEDRLRRFINSSLKRPGDQIFDQQFANNIVAEYYFGALAEEYGNLGYDDGAVRTPNYRQLFHAKMVAGK